MIFRVFFENHRNAPATVRQQAQKKNAALYTQACAALAKANLSGADAFAERLAARAPSPLRPVLVDIGAQLYRAEGFEPGSIPAPPPIPESIEAARYRDHLAACIHRLSDPEAFSRFERAVAKIFEMIIAAAPDIEEGPFTVSLLDMLPDAGRLIEQIAEALRPVSATFCERYDQNRCAASRLPFTKESLVSPRLLQPSAYSAAASELVALFLRETPLEVLASARLPFGIPDELRVEHWHLLGGSGHGKTQTLSHIIMSDLQKPNPPALIIVDSQNQMLRQIQRLALFDPEQPDSLADRLIIVDPEDDMPPALNMFAVNTSRLGGYSRVAREIVEGDILQLFSYMFASLAAELSTQMGTAFAYVTRLMLSMRPAATIHTLLEFLEENVTRAEQSRFYENIVSLDPTARGFFEKQFYKNTSFTQTRFALARRLYDVVRVPAFERMFASRQNKLSMFDAIQRGSIICVNTSGAMLKDASPLFGRFMIASTMAAVFERVAVPEREWNTAYLIIDEAASYFDENLEKLLRQARKYKLGVLFAHQLMDDLKGTMRAHVAANTSIKMFGGAGYSDARLLANEFQNTPDFLFSQKKDNRDPLHPQWTDWACYIRNVTSRAVSITVPFYALRDAPKMTEASYRTLLANNRARYAADPDMAVPAPESPPTGQNPADSSPAPTTTATRSNPQRKRPRRDPDT